jgi:hypothetical protein
VFLENIEKKLFTDIQGSLSLADIYYAGKER